MSKQLLFFDYASTTPCCDQALDLIRHFGASSFGNPSSSHGPGQAAAKAIYDARGYFAQVFRVEPKQVIFTGGGTESDNLAIQGIALGLLMNKNYQGQKLKPRILVSSIEHPAVKKAAISLIDFGFDLQFIPVDGEGQIKREQFLGLLTPTTVLVSIHQVNNIVGSILPVEELAEAAKKLVPNVIFHTDAVQAFGKTDVPVSPSSVDLVSISGHKIEGPKGVGALVVLNQALLKSNRLRPLIFGGDQEGGLRSGTQSAGLIAAFHAATKQSIEHKQEFMMHTKMLRTKLRSLLEQEQLLSQNPGDSRIRWNSPDDEAKAMPHIINLSFPGLDSAPLARLIEERKCIISTGSACDSKKSEPDAVLAAMGLPLSAQTSAIRVSFSLRNSTDELQPLVLAISDSIKLMDRLYKRHL